MRIATVVLPVPGLPVKLMCSDGCSVASPRRWRTRSTSSRAAISRTRRLTGARPTRSRSRDSSTSPMPASRNSAPRSMLAGAGACSGACVGAFSGAVMVGSPRSASAGPVGAAQAAISTLFAACAARTGERSIAGSARVPRAFRSAADGVALHRVAQVAALRFLADEAEARLGGGALDDEGHAHRLPALGRVEGVDADVVLGVGFAAGLELAHHAGGVAQVEH